MRGQMCFDHDSRPPDLPAERVRHRIAGGAGHELLTVTSADGTEFSAALAVAPDPSGPAVIVFPDVRGLYRFYAELAQRFAEAGHHAIAIDYFGRTAGLGERREDFDYMPHVMETRPRQIQADAVAVIAALRERVGDVPVVSVGFCFGGTLSFLANASPDVPLDAAVGFYGGLDTSRFKIPSPIDVAGDMKAPVLGLFGGADQGIPAELIERFERALADAGVEHDIHVYPGAPHSFFDRKYDEFAAECEDAWRRVLDFLQTIGAPA
jgi:carboxymethylenebutenolidase